MLALKFLVFQDTSLQLIIHSQLVSDHRPVLDMMPFPLGIEFLYPEIENLEDRFLAGERALLGDFSEAGIHALYRIGGIHHLPYGTAIVE